MQKLLRLDTATFANGCFWCTEAIFKRLKGVVSVIPGYTGGTLPNPSYDQVCSGNTGHAEALQIEFDPEVISYTTLLEIFWHTHNPTTLNRQGNDAGTQYRSAIFYKNAEQKQSAETSKQKLEQEKFYPDPIVTEILPLETFYLAEDYHKNYFDKNPSAPYCQVIIDPKIQKLLKEFNNEVKEEYKSTI